MLTVRVFRAIEDLASCQQFATGHANVLLEYGITKVTSSRNDWFHNPNVYVVVIETKEGVVVGGERIHITHPEFKLPIEEAISMVDDRIYDLVTAYEKEGITGELCGLWNSKQIAGTGMSVLLTKMGVALAQLLGMSSLFVLCAPYTVSMCQTAGFQIETAIGNEGTFIYPKLDLIATSLIIKDVVKISLAQPNVKAQIEQMFHQPKGKIEEIGQKGATLVQYDLSIPKFYALV